jgi:thioredoxin-related protein
MRRFLHCLLALATLASCAKTGTGGGPAATGPSSVPPQLRASGEDSGTPVAPGGNAVSADRRIDLTPEEDIVFTDPDNPDAGLPELSALLSAAPKRRGPWEESETIAKRRAVREGKPLLIWFTDSARSPMCKALNEELFSTSAFEAWASEKIIRLRVDASARVEGDDISLDEKETRLADVRHYVTRLKKQYRILGHPSLVMLNPGGEVIGRYRGYKRGDADYFWGLIKQGEAASASAYQEWRAALEKKGYREWSDRKDRKVFAKLTGYADGSLTLIEPDGTRSRTHENQLSDKDREWIARRKAVSAQGAW